MKSRITIEVNFDENNLPVIQVLSQHSDDVRDKLISSFLQSLQHTSRWCKIIYMGNRSPLAPPKDFDDPIHCWHIVPITPKEIPQERDLMEGVFERWQVPPKDPRDLVEQFNDWQAKDKEGISAK